MGMDSEIPGALSAVSDSSGSRTASPGHVVPVGGPGKRAGKHRINWYFPLYGQKKKKKQRSSVNN